MNQPISAIEASLNNQNAPKAANEEHLFALADELGTMLANNTVPEGFDMEKACTDARFIKLTREMPMAAAVRVYAAEQRAAAAESNAMAQLTAKMQKRTALPQPVRGAGAEVRRDYMNMSSEEFAALEQQYRRAAQQGIRVRL